MEARREGAKGEVAIEGVGRYKKQGETEERIAYGEKAETEGATQKEGGNGGGGGCL